LPLVMTEIKSEICSKHKIKMHTSDEGSFECPVCTIMSQRRFRRRGR